MSWLTKLIKQARRRFKSDDSIRYYTDGRKGKGKGIVLTPNFGKGNVVDYDSKNKHYVVQNKDGKEVRVHPRNIVSN